MNLIRKSIPMSSNINKKNKEINISIEYIFILLSILFILCKGCSYYLKNTENIMNYVKLLNFNIPYIETQIYKDSDYVSETSIKDIAMGGLNIKDINIYKIIGKEVSIFKSFLGDFSIKDVNDNGFKAFSLNDDSIYRMTEQEIAELKQVSEAYDESLKKVLNNTKPEVLIFHTHTTESYVERDNHTLDTDFSVVGVGEVLAKELEEGYGISVIHDKTNHSVSYNDSYLRSNETLKKYIDEYGDFKLIIDLHRDSVENKNSVTIEFNEKSLAKLMFVTAENSDNYESNTKLANNLLGISNELFPDLFRKTFIYPSGATAINHQLSDNMVLLETGSHINSAQEAKLSAKYFARIIAEHLNR